MSAKAARFVESTLASRRWSVVAPLLLALAASVVPLFGGAGRTQAAPGDDPAAVIAAYVAAVNAGDLEGILALYADDAVHIALPTPDGSAGVCLGKDQFRMWYEQSVADGDRVEVEDGTLAVDGNRVTFVARLTSDPWRALGIETLEANTEAVVVDGRITSHVVMLTPASVRALLTARGTIPAAPAGGAQAWAPGPHLAHNGNAR